MALNTANFVLIEKIAIELYIFFLFKIEFYKNILNCTSNNFIYNFHQHLRHMPV